MKSHTIVPVFSNMTANPTIHEPRAAHNARRETLVVVFFTDRWMLFGLHAALASLLANAKSVCLKVIVFSDGLTAREKKLLYKTAGQFADGHSFEIRDLRLEWPRETPTLHGNMTALARICLPSLLPDCDRVLYLDADIIVQRDVGELLLENAGEYPIHVVVYEPDEGNHDFAVIRSNIASPGTASRMFCSGVFLASLSKWRELDITRQCKDLLVRLAGTISCADQPVLNIVFYGRWGSLDPFWNILLWPHQPKIVDAESQKVIWHLLSVPKPWYPLARFAHGNFDIWHRWHKKTALARSPLSWMVNYLTPRKHYMAFALTTLRLIAVRWKEKKHRR